MTLASAIAIHLSYVLALAELLSLLFSGRAELLSAVLAVASLFDLEHATSTAIPSLYTDWLTDKIV